MYGTGFVEHKSKRKIFTKNDWRTEKVIEDDLPSLVDPAGYVDPNVRIREMIKAGIRIDEWNKAVFDYENPDEDDDGYSMDVGVFNDDNELLMEGLTSLERYRNDMSRLYRKMLLEQGNAQNDSTEPILEPPEADNSKSSKKTQEKTE